MPHHSEEFNLIEQTQNPPVPPETNYIWILSSRHTVSRKHINCPIQPAVYQITQTDHPEAMACDVGDDYERIRIALELAQKLTAQRAQKNIDKLTQKDYQKHGPYIIYNGLPKQNTELKRVIGSKNGLINLSLPKYPKSKFILLPLHKDQMHTGGQLNSLALAISQRKDKRLLGLSVDKVHVTIDTSAYHLARTRRYFNSKTFQNPLPHARITFVVSDRKFQRPCIERDCKGEITRIENYTKTKDIGEPVASNWYDIASLKNWTPLRALGHQQSEKLKQNKISERVDALDLVRLNKFGL
jgi:hypothetical protein